MGDEFCFTDWNMRIFVVGATVGLRVPLEHRQNFSATQIRAIKHDGVDYYQYDGIRAMRRPVENSEQTVRYTK